MTMNEPTTQPKPEAPAQQPSESAVVCSALLHGPPELYIVETERYEPKKDGARVLPKEYRVLARSVVEAAEIVAESCNGTEETVRVSRYASHITGLPTNRFKVVAV